MKLRGYIAFRFAVLIAAVIFLSAATCDKGEWMEGSDVSNNNGGEISGGNGSPDGDGGGGSGEGLVDVTSCGWLELPETYAGDGLSFYTHSQTIDSTVTRNYSFYWDKENHVSHWVAYPMNSWLISSGGSRSNAWAYDPLVPEEEQAATAIGSYTGSYDRGHQIASADRYDRDANKQTFYATNMTPQRSNFNQKIWAKLEEKVRGWAMDSDTLYVVTGCVMEGSDSSTTDKNGMECPIPVAYYKVVLRYCADTTIGYSGYMGAAVYMGHHDYSDTKIYSSYSMSIAEIEEKLGINFFVNLPSLIGEEEAAKVEGENPSEVGWWGFDE